MLTPLRNGILFVFLDTFKNDGFKTTTEWGFEIAGDHTTAGKEGRWAKVIAVGPEVTSNISNGIEVFVEPLMWTVGFKHEGVDVWKTDESKILLVKD